MYIYVKIILTEKLRHKHNLITSSNLLWDREQSFACDGDAYYLTKKTSTFKQRYKDSLNLFLTKK